MDRERVTKPVRMVGALGIAIGRGSADSGGERKQAGGSRVEEC